MCQATLKRTSNDNARKYQTFKKKLILLELQIDENTGIYGE